MARGGRRRRRRRVEMEWRVDETSRRSPKLEAEGEGGDGKGLKRELNAAPNTCTGTDKKSTWVLRQP
ncbi:hypothetical protein TcWFU_007564 [Taenia crassiceps]|uniref:Uncharacterized protein n=1 Tax=Taenia crassiceps TaxID=6207 RepID=A0ABR4Q9T6_9CEST